MAEFGCIHVLVIVIGLVIAILITLSFSYVEFYEYGLVQRRSTGSVNIEKVYPGGRYFIGPDHKFLTYPADTEFVHIEAMPVFSASTGNSETSIGLDFFLDIDFTYSIIEEETGSLHKELAMSYKNVVLSRVKDALKNDAINIGFSQFFEERMAVERRLRKAVEVRMDEEPKTHVRIDQFHLGRILIPETVAKKQLEAQIQNERNGKENYLQEAEVERQKTTVQVNKISLEMINLLATTNAEAGLIRAKAVTRANEIKNQAQLNGTKALVDTTGIDTQEHKTAFTYLRNLMNRGNLDIDVSYLSSDSIVKVNNIG